MLIALEVALYCLLGHICKRFNSPFTQVLSRRHLPLFLLNEVLLEQLLQVLLLELGEMIGPLVRIVDGRLTTQIHEALYDVLNLTRLINLAHTAVIVFIHR